MKKICLLMVALFAAQAHADETLGQHLEKASGMHVDSLGAATGIYFLYDAYQKYQQKDMGGALTAGALGASTALGAVTLVTRANAKEMDDPVKNFMKTEDYKNLAKEVGDKKARQFVLDLNSGWSVEKLYAKYGDIYKVSIVKTKTTSNSDGGENAEKSGGETSGL